MGGIDSYDWIRHLSENTSADFWQATPRLTLQVWDLAFGETSRTVTLTGPAIMFN